MYYISNFAFAYSQQNAVIHGLYRCQFLCCNFFAGPNKRSVMLQIFFLSLASSLARAHTHNLSLRCWVV